MISHRAVAVGAGLVALIAILSALGPLGAPAHVGHSAAAAPPSGIGLAHRTTPASAAQAASDRVATTTHILSAVHASGVPSRYVYLPNFNAPETRTGSVVAPTYGHSPAPYGIAAVGVTNTSGTAVGTVYNSSSFKGSITFNDLNAFYLDDDSTDYVGAQLNTVVSNITLFGNTSYSYWNQNVVAYSARSHLLQFIDNIWNFSSPAFYLTDTTFLNHSSNGTGVFPTFYYALGPVLNLSMPFTLDLYINATTTTIGGLPYDEVFFNYSVLKAGAYVANGNYDWAIFNSQNLSAPRPTIPAPVYQVNGLNLTPTGFLPYDAELVLCGPGGGSTTSLYAVNATMHLDYWNASTLGYQSVPSAVAYGTNTGETVEGVAEWWDPSGTVHLGPGPTLSIPLWNSSPSATPGYLALTGTVTPSNGFVFVNQTTGFNSSWAAWAPVPPSGAVAYNLTPANYSGEVLMSNYDPVTFATNLTNASTWVLNGSLAFDPSQGIYTPLFAWTNAQVAAISSTGDGSAGNPYVLWNDQYGSLDPAFGSINDFFFPVFPGLLLAHTTVHVNVVDPPSFYIAYQDRVLHDTVASLLPPTNHLQMELYGTTGVTIWGSPLVTGWFSANLAGFPLANIVAWNTTNTLIGSNYFLSQGSSLLLFGGTNNTIWGNTFVSDPTMTYYFGALNNFGAFGLQLFENNDTIYNNLFNVPVSVYSPSYTLYTETFYNSNAATWTDRWNVSLLPASWPLEVNGEWLYGNIVGGAWQGGNFWWDYVLGDPLPYSDGGLIATGGDALPLLGSPLTLEASLTFTEVGLPAGTSWGVTVNGYALRSTAATIEFWLINGTYSYTVAPVPGYRISSTAGTVDLGGPVSLTVTFSVPPTPLYSVSFVETGLPAGTSWGVTLGAAGSAGFKPGTLDTITVPLANGTYNFSIVPVIGYSITNSSGNLTVNGGAVVVGVAFTAKPGVISGTVTPASASVWVDSAAATVAADGTFSMPVSPGLHAVRASASGYVAYFNNVSVSAGGSASVSISLTSQPGGSTGSSNTVSGTTLVLLVSVGVLAVIFLVGMVYFWSRSRQPPETTQSTEAAERPPPEESP